MGTFAKMDFALNFILQRYEDTDLDLQPLPPPKLVPTPEGVANELFGDIAMITEFIGCYKKLLLPEDDSKSLVTTGMINIEILRYLFRSRKRLLTLDAIAL